MKIYKLFIDVGGCAYTIKFNDVIIMSRNNGGVLSTELPVNEWMLYGVNTIDIRISPLEGKEYAINAHFTLSFFQGIDQENKEEEFYTFQKNELTGKLPIKEIKIKNVLDETFKDSLIQDLPVIDITDSEIAKGFFQTCESIYTQFQNGKKAEILELFNQRQLDYSKCYERGEEVYINNLDEALSFVFTAKEYEILGFIVPKMRPRLSLFGKLASLEYFEYKKPFVNFSNTENRNVMKSFPIYLALDEKNEWFVCR